MTNKTKKGDSQTEEKTPHLSISAHVVVQLGEELVTDTEQALLELAKNAYDADSKACEITIDPNWVLTPEDPVYDLLSDKTPKNKKKLPIPTGRIRIRDYGTGISAEDVKNGWLRISASLKRNKGDAPKKKTKEGRTPVGDKGLGRLATMKLGKALRMKTAIENEHSWRTVTFSWDDFTEERRLEDVPVKSEIDTNEEVDSKGTLIEIIGLNEKNRWADTNHIEQHLIPRLSSLINPFKTIDSFDISLHLGKHSYELRSLGEDILNLASAKFTFIWDGEKMTQTALIAESLFRGASGEKNKQRFNKLFDKKGKPLLTAWLQKEKRLTERGLSFEVESPWFCEFSDELDGTPFPKDSQYPHGSDPGPFEATIYYFMFHEEMKEKLTHAGSSVASLQSMSQVAIFRDGFRVRAHRDWLNLSEGTTTGSSYYGLRPANTIGYFALTNEHNPKLIEKSDREGFVDNNDFRGFIILGTRARDYANGVLETVRKSVNKYEKTLNHGKNPPSRKSLRNTLSRSQKSTDKSFTLLQNELAQMSIAIDASRVADQKTTLPASTIGKAITVIESHLNAATKVVDEISLTIQKQIKASLQLADMSADDEDYVDRLLDAAAVGLAARSLSHEFHEHLRQLRDGIAIATNVNKNIKQPELSLAVRKLNSTTRELSKTIATIDPMLPGTRAIKENINLRKFLIEYVDARKIVAEKYGIELALHLEGEVDEWIIRFSRARLLQIVENLFQNSLYWLRQDMLPNPNVCRIDVSLTSDGITWSDTGPGIKRSIESSIFDSYVSDKPKSEASGLGLHIVSTFLEMERCSIKLSEKRNSIARRYEFELNMIPARLDHQHPKLQV